MTNKHQYKIMINGEKLEFYLNGQRLTDEETNRMIAEDSCLSSISDVAVRISREKNSRPLEIIANLSEIEDTEQAPKTYTPFTFAKNAWYNGLERACKDDFEYTAAKHPNVVQFHNDGATLYNAMRKDLLENKGVQKCKHSWNLYKPILRQLIDNKDPKTRSEAIKKQLEKIKPIDYLNAAAYGVLAIGAALIALPLYLLGGAYKPVKENTPKLFSKSANLFKRAYNSVKEKIQGMRLPQLNPAYATA